MTRTTAAIVGPPHHRVRMCSTCYWLSLMVAILFMVNTLLIASRLHLMDQKVQPAEQSPLQLLLRSSQRLRTRSFARNQQLAEEKEVNLPLQKPMSWLVTDEETKRIQKAEKDIGGISCRRARVDQKKYTFNADFCEDSPVVYYNPLPQDRILCGKTIEANSRLTLDSKCKTPARLFPRTPDRTGKDMPAVQISFDANNWKGTKPFECDVPCESGGNVGIVKQRFVKTIDGGGNNWSLMFSMEGEAYYKSLKINPTAYKTNSFYSTTSYKSEVPLPYFSWAEYKIQSPAVDFDKAIKGASFLARNCNSQNQREKIVRELQKTSFRVDSLSSCLRNAQPPPGVNLGDKNSVMQHYLFYLAFENQCTEDYITEKLWGPLESGTIPVYYGSPNVKEHVPVDSVIWVGDFASADDLALYLNKVANNRELYNKHQAWRTQPLPPHFHAKYDFTAIHSTCRTCRWAYARFYGLGWDHANQRLRELATPRAPHVQDGLLKRPVVELWRLQSQQPVSTVSAEVGERYQTGVVDIDGGYLRRTVWEQDGAIDLLIEEGKRTRLSSSGKPYLLRLETPFPDNDDAAIKFNAVSPGHLRIQNDKTRYTILTWPRLVYKTKMNSAGGIVEIPMSHGSFSSSILPVRIRILVEDIDTLHQGADDEENFFGSLMIRDFYTPVEAFTTKHRP